MPLSLIHQTLFVLIIFTVLGTMKKAEALVIPAIAPVALQNQAMTTHKGVTQSQKQDWGDLHKYHPIWDWVWD